MRTVLGLVTSVTTHSRPPLSATGVVSMSAMVLGRSIGPLC